MTRWNTAAPIGGTVNTVDGSTVSVCSLNLANGQDQNGNQVGFALDNVMVHFKALLLGRSGANRVRLYCERSFSREGGVSSSLDNTILSPLTNFASAALAAAAIVLDNSGDVVRLRATGVLATSITWTGYLWILTGEFGG